MFENDFKQRLKAELENNKISQNTLARRIGVDRAMITRYLDGDAIPKALTFFRLCECLNVDTDYMLGYSQTRKDFQGYTNMSSSDTKFFKVAASLNTTKMLERFSILSEKDQLLILSMADRLIETYDCP